MVFYSLGLLLEEGGKEGKRGPFRGQNFSRLEEGCPRVRGARVRGRGWSEGSTPGEAGEKKKTPPPRNLLILGEK